MYYNTVIALLYFLFYIASGNTVSSKTVGLENFHRLTRAESEDLRKKCGVANTDDKAINRISHGQRAKQGQFPWAVALASQNFSICTGSLISRYHIITAAHCLNYAHHEYSSYIVLMKICDILPKNDSICKAISQNFKPPPLKEGILNVNVSKTYCVYGGSPCIFDEKLNSATETFNCSSNDYKKARRLEINHIIIPRSSFIFNAKLGEELFKDLFGFSDIAILELKQPISENDPDLNPICLPDIDTEISKEFRAFGFGTTEKIPFYPKVQNSQLYAFAHQGEIMEDKECRNAMRLLSQGKYMFLKEYCNRAINVFFQSGDPTTTCGGDSGGGLTGKVDGREYLFGVLSRGSSFCNEPEMLNEMYEDRYSKVSFYHDFICYYTGICPKGYDKYVDKKYNEHPEPVAFLSDGTGKKYIEIGDVVYPKRKQPSSI